MNPNYEQIYVFAQKYGYKVDEYDQYGTPVIAILDLEGDELYTGTFEQMMDFIKGYVHYKIDKIGPVYDELDSPCFDMYYHVKVVEGTNTIESVEKYFLEAFYQECYSPGGHFCHSVTVIPRYKNDNDTYIVIVHHRYDV